MDAFVYTAHPARAVFGAGALGRLPAVVERLGLHCILVLSTPQQDSKAGAAARWLCDLAVRFGATPSLKDLGMPAEGIDKAADLATANPYWSPRALDRSAIRDLIARAYAPRA